MWALFLRVLPFLASMLLGAGVKDAVNGVSAPSSVAFWIQTFSMILAGSGGVAGSVYVAKKRTAGPSASSLLSDLEALQTVTNCVGRCAATDKLTNEIVATHLEAKRDAKK